MIKSGSRTLQKVSLPDKIKTMLNKIKNKQSGFLKIIIIIVVALLLMRYFGITFSGILDYFHLTWIDVIGWLKKALDWFKDLFNSVK
ncbi:hypothetical protein A2643_03840 [Candidatus Nomurabacteria bacterium RIFCSPHIGHO2_01_FULL_39_220]|uniref:Uncharacterized protein n=1 Tax=Candidatus Nomurabacteria bacterium RIFCSPLOWO2_02_FULL_40_67 TaxID=1801787 RepID=A0A1F6Y5I7_9BACT|nr:MAG: hypothetical protein UU01_C0004G0020 [Parcubacteria group bacterium GW2011_GWA2_40_37]KKS11611.1 MAG: hypothetical protein UU66_C0013G0005 [Parcubacteria group bacterium GW2011_GWB1_41_5]OGI62810.1 MAG: hypothetical protein A2W12_03410 [Candidatus Nomurabacteria bacterium RBG_16_40_11]OGI69737.1 MAG: hypothetical protein A2643_03840 [Candidatus Nomurabacteria bacterium RIFCSPHIGHO2_01_FULL_39_220]OGI72596.1 MAG: hypothetical protein A2W56_01415 [Candidatus Nomurabacteria bacterium RIFCS